MNHLLAATTSGTSFFHGLAHAFDQVRHLIAQIGKVGLPVIIIIAILIHLVLARQGQVFTIHHHLETMILTVGLVVVFPQVTEWLAHLTVGGRGGFDAVVLVVAFSDVLFGIASRFTAKREAE